MRKLLVGATRSDRSLHVDAKLREHRFACAIQLVNGRRVPRARELPLLFWPVDVAPVMKERPETLLEARLVLAADEGIDEGGPEIPIPLQELENLDIARRQLHMFARCGTRHAGAALRRCGGDLHTERRYRYFGA